MVLIPLPRILAGVTLFAVFTGVALAQEKEAKPPINQAGLTSEQLAVYRTVLVTWFQSEKFSVNLSELTDLSDYPDGSSDTECGKGLLLEKPVQEVHRFQAQDLDPFGVGSHIHLVDPDAQSRKVHENDPGDAIRKGAPVDDAVKNGFSHGLFTLGEIRFDRDHTHAVVSFSFVCGGLCGHGSTLLLEKKNGTWKQKKQCGGWIS